MIGCRNSTPRACILSGDDEVNSGVKIADVDYTGINCVCVCV
jgi:hypothetical protein